MFEPVSFVVDGVPIPQGSKTAFVVGRRAVVTDANKAKLKPWREAVKVAAGEALRVSGGVSFVGPVRVSVRFAFVRPVSVKGRVWPSVKPDVDKLVRAILDGMTDSGLIKDDALVVELVAVKVYAGRPCARVVVGPMADASNEERVA